MTRQLDSAEQNRQQGEVRPAAPASDAAREPSGRKTLLELFAAQAARTPQAVAVVDERRQMTYRQLEIRSSQLANLLREYGVITESLVGVCLNRSVSMAVALLGVWKAGAAYVPLDPEYPADRVGWIAGDTRAKIVLTEGALVETVSVGGAYLMALDVIEDRLLRYSTTPPDIALVPDSAAYAVYTSGSTGQPKGVLVTHGGIANRVCWTVGQHGLGPGDRVLQKTPLTFDAAGWEIFAPLISGGTVVLAAPGLERDPVGLVEAVAKHEITVLQVVPSVLRLLVEAPGWERCGLLRLLFSAGEPLHAELCQRLLERVDVTVWNTYGPTECSIDVTAHRFDPAQSSGPVSIGSAIDNTRALVLGPDGELVPLGVRGELYVGGHGLARGYVGRPELTAERFVPDPYGPAGARLYRTGDLVRWRTDGTLEYLGRIDHQVKVNGVRIEPAEVEAALASHPLVAGVVVQPFTAQDGTQRLAAYIHARREVTANEWRRFLGTRLPSAYIPAAFVPVAEFPLGTSGKVDRSALPAPTEGWAPRERDLSRDEEAVARIWGELLSMDAGRAVQIRPQDDFFSLGGSSLLLTRLAGMLTEASGQEILVHSLYEASTLESQAELMAGTGAGAGQPPERTPPEDALPHGAIPPVRRDEPLPLSFGQQRLWILDRMRPASPEWVTPVFVRLPIGISRDTVRRALEIVQRRHDVLRTRYVMHGQETHQVIDPVGPVELRVIEAVGGNPVSLLSDEFRRGFDLATGRVWRAALARVAGQEQYLLMTVHHIACDGWSSVVLERELREACLAIHAGREPVLPVLPVQYADFAAWQRGRLTEDVVTEQIEYWRRTLEGSRPLRLPTDRPRPTEHDPRGALEVFSVPADVANALIELGRANRATPFATFVTAFCTLLARYSGQWDVPVGTTVAGRSAPEVENLVGLFLNTLVLRCRLDRRMSFQEAVVAVGEVCRSAFAHQDIPFERLVDELRPTRDLSRTPLYQVMFDFQDEGVTGSAPDDESHRAMREVWHVARLDLTLVLQRRRDGSMVGFVEYATALFDADTMARLARHFGWLLRSIVANPARALADLEVVPAQERELVLAWCAGDTVSRPRMTTSEAFEAQVRATPDAVAVVAGGRRMTYAELDARANRLAWRLREAGVGPESVVGILLDRGTDVLVSHLAVWKAGGAYLPLDSALPVERIEYMLTDSAASALVATTSTAAAAAGYAGPRILLDEQGPAVAAYPPPGTPEPDGLAYIIYTSGSTGRPKGVQVGHDALLNLVLATRAEAEVSGPAAGWLAVAPTSFDVAVNELYVPLLAGGRVIMATAAELDDPAAQVSLVHRYEVTHVGISPSRWRLLLDAGLDRPALVALMGGEQCPPDLARELRGRVSRLLNEYGPTEATVAATIWEVPPDPESLLIGKPLPNMRAYVLDEDLNLVPPDVVGELYLGGAGLARGYVRQPVLTAERFVPDPYGPHGSRLYRTGDLCRLGAGGDLSFVGRVDDQVKIRGYRVELGEVQAVLAGHPAVRAAAVVALFRLGSQQLVAYCVAGGQPLPEHDELTAYCRRHLPEYMVPTMFIPLDEMPLTRHGKVDYGALPDPEMAYSSVEADFVHPRNVAEERIAQVWREVLGVDISVTANFFVLGGNSLLATQVIARLQQEFETELQLRTIFDHPTVAGLAEAVEEAIRVEVERLSEAELVAEPLA